MKRIKRNDIIALEYDLASVIRTYICDEYQVASDDYDKARYTQWLIIRDFFLRHLLEEDDEDGTDQTT